jgi:hypothetical protein
MNTIRMFAFAEAVLITASLLHVAAYGFTCNRAGGVCNTDYIHRVHAGPIRSRDSIHVSVNSGPETAPGAVPALMLSVR